MATVFPSISPPPFLQKRQAPGASPSLALCSLLVVQLNLALGHLTDSDGHGLVVQRNPGILRLAGHLAYFPRFMDDSIAEERYFGMEAGKRLMMQCKEFLVVTVENVISEGMNEEIDYMTNRLMMQGKSINFTRLGLETVIHSRLER